MARRLRFLAPLLLAAALSLVGCAAKAPPAPEPPAPVAEAPAPPPPPSLQELILATARSQIGAPYQIGGCDPREGFDCSGFVRWVFAQHGLELPRTTSEQMAMGNPVPLKEIAPGDLLFFRIGKSPKDLHATIATGPAAFIHSPRSGERVREDELSDWWVRRWLKARRVLP